MSVKMCLSLGIIVIALSTTAPCAQEIFTWLDEKGIRHFSDTPQKGADVVILPNLKANTPTSLPLEPLVLEPSVLKSTILEPQTFESSSFKPLSLTILNPQHDMTIRSNQGIIMVQLKSNRPLENAEHLQLLLDGKPYGAPQHNLDWRLNNIDRGTHTLTVQTIRNGKLIASTSPITVHLHRASVSSSN